MLSLPAPAVADILSTTTLRVATLAQFSQRRSLCFSMSGSSALATSAGRVYPAWLPSCPVTGRPQDSVHTPWTNSHWRLHWEGAVAGRCGLRCAPHSLPAMFAVAIGFCAGPGARFVRCLPCSMGCLDEGDADRELATLNVTRFLLSVVATFIVGPSLTQCLLQ